MPSNPGFRFAPSDVHQALQKAVRPSLAWGGGEVKPWQRRLRRKLKQLLGAWPAERVPLKPKTLWRLEHDLGAIEKVVFTSEPGADVPAYVCLPRNAEPPYPFFICLQGHSSGMHNSIAVAREDETRPIEVEGDRDFALGCMARGIAALCVEQRAFGERMETRVPHHGGWCHHAAMNSLLLGRTLIGERVWDVARALDYLGQRDDADPKRVGLMGNSGGGTITLFASAMLPGIAWAMPSCYLCTFRDSIGSIHHCQCNYVPGLLSVADMGDILALHAPKPLVVVSGREDEIFPIRAARSEFKRVKAVYRALGAETNCRHVIGEGGHRFYAEAAWKAMQPLMR